MAGNRTARSENSGLDDILEIAAAIESTSKAPVRAKRPVTPPPPVPQTSSPASPAPPPAHPASPFFAPAVDVSAPPPETTQVAPLPQPPPPTLHESVSLPREAPSVTRPSPKRRWWIGPIIILLVGTTAGGLILYRQRVATHRSTGAVELAAAQPHPQAQAIPATRAQGAEPTTEPIEPPPPTLPPSDTPPTSDALEADVASTTETGTDLNAIKLDDNSDNEDDSEDAAGTISQAPVDDDADINIDDADPIAPSRLKQNTTRTPKPSTSSKRDRSASERRQTSAAPNPEPTEHERSESPQPIPDPQTSTTDPFKTKPTSTTPQDPPKSVDPPSTPTPDKQDHYSSDCILHPDRPGCGSDSKSKPSTSDNASSEADDALPQKLSTSQLRVGIAKIRGSARQCGERFGVGMGTAVRVKFSIEGATGNVIDAEALPPDTGTPLGDCVAKTLFQASFPRFKAAKQGATFPVRL